MSTGDSGNQSNSSWPAVSPDLLVELVESRIRDRIRERRRTTRRWAIGTIVSLLGLVVAGYSFLERRAENRFQEDLRDLARVNRSVRVGDLTATQRFDGALRAGTGVTQVALARFQRRQFALEIEETGSYSIEAIAGADEDPVIYLYCEPGPTAIEEGVCSSERGVAEVIAYNDDGGSSLNSRIEETLHVGNTYYLEVENYRGEGGAIELRISGAD